MTISKVYKLSFFLLFLTIGLLVKWKWRNGGLNIFLKASLSKFNFVDVTGIKKVDLPV